MIGTLLILTACIVSAPAPVPRKDAAVYRVCGIYRSEYMGLYSYIILKRDGTCTYRWRGQTWIGTWTYTDDKDGPWVHVNYGKEFGETLYYLKKDRTSIQDYDRLPGQPTVSPTDLPNEVQGGSQNR